MGSTLDLSGLGGGGGPTALVADTSIFANMGRYDQFIKNKHFNVDSGVVLGGDGSGYFAANLGPLTIDGVTNNYLALEKISIGSTGTFTTASGLSFTDPGIAYNATQVLVPSNRHATQAAALRYKTTGGILEFAITRFGSSGTLPVWEDAYDFSTNYPAWVTGNVGLQSVTTNNTGLQDGIALSDTLFCKVFTLSFLDSGTGFVVGWIRLFFKFFYNGATWVTTVLKIHEEHEKFGPGVNMITVHAGGNLCTLGGAAGQFVAYSFADRVVDVNHNEARVVVVDTGLMTVAQNLQVTDQTLGTDYPINMNTTGGTNYSYNEYLALSSASWRSNDNDDRPWFAVYRWNGTALVSVIAATRPTGGNYIDTSYRMSLTDVSMGNTADPKFAAVSYVRVPGVLSPTGNGTYIPVVYDIDVTAPAVTGRIAYGFTELPIAYGAWAISDAEQSYADFTLNCVWAGGERFIKLTGPRLFNALLAPFSPEAIASPLSDSTLADLDATTRDTSSRYKPFANTLIPNSNPGTIVEVSFSPIAEVKIPAEINPRKFTIPVANIAYTVSYKDGQITNISGPKYQAAHGLAVGNLVRFNGTSYVKAQANTAAESEVVGIVDLVPSVNTFTMTTQAVEVTGLTGLTAGATYFLSQATAGAMVTPEPVSGISKPVLIATSTTSGVFINMRGVTL